MPKREPDEDLPRKDFDWTYSDRSNPQEPEAFTSIRHILHPRELPAAESLSDLQLIGLLNEAEFELLQRQIQVDFLDALPPRVAYKGILQMLDTPLEISGSAYQIQHLDGCDSACESCFQVAYCQVAKEILGKDWRLAVQQAGINPSWSALFGRE